MAIVRVLLRRELLDLAREKRSLMVALILPLILYPAGVALSGHRFRTPPEEVPNAPPMLAVSNDLAELKPFLRDERIMVENPTANLKQAITLGMIDGAISRGKGKGGIQLLLDRRKCDDRYIRRRIEQALSAWHQYRLGRDLHDQPAKRHQLITRRVALQGMVLPKSTRAGEGMAALIPIILVLILISGTAFAALDILPGQKERGILETLFIQPVLSGEVILAKFLAIFSMGMVAIAINMTGMGITSTLLAGAEAPSSFGLGQGLLMFLLALPLALAVTGLIVWICTLARSFREGQNYLLPLTLCCLLPAGLGLSRALPLNAFTGLLPITGTVLVFRDALQGNFPVLPILAMVVGSLAWGSLAIRTASRLLQNESVRLGFDPASLLDPTHNPPGKRALFWAVLILFAYLVLAPILIAKLALGGLVISLVILILVPALLLPKLLHFPRERSFPLAPPNWASLAGTLLVALGLFLFATGYLPLQKTWLPLPQEFTRNMSAMLLEGTNKNLVLILLIGALLPAICEECLFRGPLLGAFRVHWGDVRAVFFTALLFAINHLSVHRFIPELVVGLVFAILVLRTRCLPLAICCHFLYNGMILSLATLSDSIPQSFSILLLGESIPQVLLRTIGGILLVGTGLLISHHRLSVRDIEL